MTGKVRRRITICLYLLVASLLDSISASISGTSALLHCSNSSLRSSARFSLLRSLQETQLAILSPAGPEKENLYHESHFNILDPNGIKQDGDVVRYGEEFVLADDNGMSWNHTSGGEARSAPFSSTF